MYISGVDYESLADGYGTRTVIYVSGCTHNCFGCHNPDTHNPLYGELLTSEIRQNIIDTILSIPFITGITFSGGDPLYEKNIPEIYDFICLINDKIKPVRKNFNIWLYTGYTWNEILKLCETNRILLAVIDNLDVLVDGRFEIDKADKTLLFRGSSNQNLIDVQKTLQNNNKIITIEGK